jgi:hypothetical protein
MSELERRDFDKYFDKMVQMVELNSTGQEKFSSHIDILTKTVELLIGEIKTNEELLREILDKMKVTSNETLNIELQKIKDLNMQLQMTSIQLLQEVKDFCDNDSGMIIKEKVLEVLGKIASLDDKIKTIEEKDKKLDNFMKLIGIGLALFLALFTTFSAVMQSNNTDKIERAIQQINKKAIK